MNATGAEFTIAATASPAALTGPRASRGTGNLPADSVVQALDALGVGDAHQVHDRLPGSKQLRHLAEFGRPVADHDRAGMVEHLLDVVHHQLRDVRDLVQDVLAVGAVD